MCDFDTWFLIVLIYIVKFTLVVKRPRPSIAIVLFFCTIMVAVPYIYLRVVDWTETFNVDPLGHWIGTPVMMLFIPVATFIYDLSTKKRIKPKREQEAGKKIEQLYFSESGKFCYGTGAGKEDYGKFMETLAEAQRAFSL